ncbi:MAG: rRNA maturation RNase YbeY [Planctomycetota bacterium]|nr:MAG: rRNA maturation RNase YbeY [Planctomycetota bacterium]
MHTEKQKKKDITVQITNSFHALDASLPKLKKLVKTICNRFAKYEIPNTGYEVTIAIVDDAQIRKVNKQFLNHNLSTDCLSFDLSDDAPNSAKSFELLVNAEMARKQAKRRGHSTEAELALYITHALLHNLGFDDTTQNQAKKMHHTEDEILQQLDYGLVYNKAVKAQK